MLVVRVLKLFIALLLLRLSIQNKYFDNKIISKSV